MTSEQKTSSNHAGKQRVVGTGAKSAAPRIGVIGGGQLARMMQEAAAPLGIELDALVEASDGSAAQVIPESRVAQADDVAAIMELARHVDALTVEHEHVPEATLKQAEQFAPVRPNATALRYAQDKIAMRTRMGELGIPGPRWFTVNSADDVAAALRELGGRAVLKTPRDGYDGKGVRIIDDVRQADDWFAEGPLLVEELIPFEMEVAQLVARRPSGEIRSWPVVRTVQQQGTCFEVVAPAPGIGEALATEIRELGESIARELAVVGILAVELFLARDSDGTLRPYVNELAMRPHNSGHWTIEGSTTSQFEQHVRAVLDLPLGDTALRAPWSVMVNILGSQLRDPRDAYPQAMARYPSVKFHMYGKAVKPRRKIGHVTAVGSDLQAALAAAHGAAAILRGEDSE
ncbi:MAG: 5-(carboxyamino)imidazole ribonucleotide synthase [Ancrocorticia sp.]|nr:5-(carboxyamino)imidazole ribonucleotide synthase [Ancrocorticia sp.]MCI2194007.1 5-(carboxyamino)imidazole ribonucleotide synthase [Ancrocorticia sp.]MCI2198997.1 5-(carboxyamino)imidazole ribonucleotide synthase [Ancrocorticia sp.]